MLVSDAAKRIQGNKYKSFGKRKDRSEFRFYSYQNYNNCLFILPNIYPIWLLNYLCKWKIKISRLKLFLRRNLFIKIFRWFGINVQWKLNFHRYLHRRIGRTRNLYFTCCSFRFKYISYCTLSINLRENISIHTWNRNTSSTRKDMLTKGKNMRTRQYRFLPRFKPNLKTRSK